MRRLAAALVLSAMTAPTVAASIVHYEQAAESPTLGHPIPFALYMPDAAPAAGERWPVLYLLHGKEGRDGDWFWMTNLAERLDAAIEAGTIPPLVVVAPGFGDSWYVDDAATALVDDLVPAVDALLPTAACRAGRAIGGYSMGGYGALLQALDHADTYAAALSFAGALDEPLAPDDERLEWLSQGYGDVFGTPFDRERFNAASPFTHVDHLRDAADTPAFYLTIGKGDYPGFIAGNTALRDLLDAAGADVTLKLGAGDHGWASWQDEIGPALEWLGPKLSARC